MPTPLKVLFVEDRQDDVDLVLYELRKADFDVTWQRVQTPADFVERLSGPVDIILADFNMPQFDAPSALKLLHDSGKDIPFIVVSGSIGEDVAVEIMKQGATDYLLKDRLARLGASVQQALARKQLRLAQQRAEAAAHASEERFRLLVEGIKDYAIFMLDASGRIETWNRGAELLLGHRAEEILGQHYACVFAADDVAAGKPAAELDQAAQNGRCDVEGWRVHKDGSRFWANGVLSVLRDPQGQVRGFAKITRDLTERRRAAQLLRSILDSTIDGIINITEQGTIVSFNHSAETIFGWKASEVLGSNIRVLMPEPYHSNHDAYIANYLRTGMAKIIGRSRPEVVGRRKDGATFAMELAVTEFRLDTVGERHFTGVVRDISRRKRAEEAQARLLAILESTPDFVGMADTEGRPVFLNRAGRRLVGHTHDHESLHAHLLQYHPEWARTLIAQEAIPEANRNGSWLGESALLTLDGQEIPVSQAVLVHLGADGAVDFFSTIARDLRHQKKLEEQLRQSQKMEAIGQLAGGIAHDFNNLLTVISGYSDLMLMTLPPDHPQRQSVIPIRDASERAAALIQQLLAFSRKQLLTPRELDLNSEVAALEKMLRRMIGEDIDLATRLDPDVPNIKADPGQLGQILINLAVNARDAMPQGGKLTIETRAVTLDAAYVQIRPGAKPGRHVILSVTDTGVGMDKATLHRIFEPFFTTKEPGKGTGLGLAVVHGVVKQSGGHLNVYSELGQGTCFKIYLPAIADPGGRLSNPGLADSPVGRETILLVEDDPDVRQLALVALQSFGYTVVDVAKGPDAIRLAEVDPQRFHLLVSDVVMPDMSGRQLAEALRPLCPNLKVIFMSGYTNDAIIRHGVLTAGTAFLQKPFSPVALARKVREVLDGP